MSENNDFEIGLRVKALREARDMTQEDLATAVNYWGEQFTQQTVFRLEKGQRTLKYTEAKHVADAIGVSMDAFLGEADPGEMQLVKTRRALDALYIKAQEAVFALRTFPGTMKAFVDAEDAYWHKWRGSESEKVRKDLVEEFYGEVRCTAMDLLQVFADTAPVLDQMMKRSAQRLAEVGTDEERSELEAQERARIAAGPHGKVPEEADQ
ncbi:MAG: helix-turn-helix domain-containing protein [Segniliparus sp.]|uniref:helix-turn-helix domain-containing protein n=1 Tax=Segniliparus sp. TaxID=2804064 RepID=UPI003F3442CC